MPHTRTYGHTGITVGLLGYGAGHIGGTNLAEDEVGSLLNRLVDAGVTLIDTARGYGLSEERIGRHLSWRRGDFTLSTKVGYGVDGVPDWTYECVTAGVERACLLMRTDHLDIVHLHSCPRETLERGEVIAALERAKADGKVRAIAYSGDNEALEYAIGTGRFDGVECSLNLCDQRVIDRGLAQSRARGRGLVAKRPVANAPWRYPERPVGEYAEEYWVRLQAMGLDPQGLPWQELALRFAAFQDGVTSVIVGTTKFEHLADNLRILERGPLPAEQDAAIKAAFAEHDYGWDGQV